MNTESLFTILESLMQPLEKGIIPEMRIFLSTDGRIFCSLHAKWEKNDGVARCHNNYHVPLALSAMKTMSLPHLEDLAAAVRDQLNAKILS